MIGVATNSIYGHETVFWREQAQNEWQIDGTDPGSQEIAK
jgi:hypothetical protein